MSRRCSRRRALRLLGSTTAATGLAGCLGGPLASVRTPTATEPTAGPASLDLRFDITVDQSFTDAHPGQVSITLENREDDPLVMGTAHGIEGPFSAVRLPRNEGEDELVLLADPPTGEHATPPGAPCRSGEYAIPASPTDGCWQPACEFSVMHAHGSATIPAGGILAWPYVVLDGFNESCLPPGTYRATTTAPIARSPPTPTMGPTPPGGWSYRLEKRVTLELVADGGLSATASYAVSPAG